MSSGQVNSVIVRTKTARHDPPVDIGDDDAERLGARLYERLRELFPEHDNDDDLAHELGTPPRDISRLKKGFGPNQIKLIGLLDVAGWLSPDSDLTPDEARERAKLYQQARRIQRRQRRDGRADG